MDFTTVCFTAKLQIYHDRSQISMESKGKWRTLLQTGIPTDRAKTLASKLPAATEEQLRRLPEDSVAVLHELFEQAGTEARPHILLAFEERVISILSEKLNMSESLAVQLVTGMELGFDNPSDVVAVMKDSTQTLAFLQQWAKSPACERALDSISLVSPQNP